MVRYVDLVLLIFFSEGLLSNASGNIGCLFSETLCSQEKEWCFDDYAFGRCLPLYGNIKEEDLYRYDLGTTELHLLEREMQRLFLLGYRWSHTYTQCVLQVLLDTIRDGSEFDVSPCNDELDQDLEGALKAIEGEEMEHIDPRNLAIVRFTPSVVNPHSDYADELYYPPPTGELLPPYKPPNDETNGEHQNPSATLEETRDQTKQQSVSTSEESKEQETNKIKQKQQKQAPEVQEGPMTAALKSSSPIIPLSSPDIPMAIGLSEQQPDYGFRDNFDYYSYRSPYEDLPPMGPIYRKRSGYFGNTVLSPREPAEGFVTQDLLGEKANLRFAVLRDIAESLNKQKHKERFDKYPKENPLFLQENANSNGQMQQNKDVSQNPFYHQTFMEPYFLYQGYRDPFLPFGQPRQMPGYPPPHAGYGSLSDKNDGWNHQLPELRLPNPDKDYFSEDIHPPYNNNPQDSPESDYETQYRDGAQNGGVSPNSYSNSLTRYNKNGELSLKTDYPNYADTLDFANNYDFQEDEPHNQNNYPFKQRQSNKINSAFEGQLNTGAKLPYPSSNYNYRGSHPPVSPEYYYDTSYGGSYPYYPDFDYIDTYPPPTYDPKFVKKDEEAIDGEYYYPHGLQYWNLQRNERQDVKKPGPKPAFPGDYGEQPFGTHPHISRLGRINQMHYENAPYDMMGYRNPSMDKQMQDNVEIEQIMVDDVGDMAGLKPEDGRNGPRQEYLTSHSESRNMNSYVGQKTPFKQKEAAPPEPQYVHVHFREKFESQKEAEEMLDVILRDVDLNRTSVKDFSVQGENELRFHVKEHEIGTNAATVAQKIYENKEKIKKKTGKDITVVGPKGSITSVVYDSNESMIRAAAIVCGVCAALLIAASALFLLKRHSASKAKLQGLRAHDSEASKDYQDLCRARMAGKGDGKDKGSVTPGYAHPTSSHAPGQRISSLSKESDNGNNSPSSRSSTSSWSEEPVISNMDISTGHMVLSYMEDHLRNKDRLEQEWIDLCAYEAEPNTCSIALKGENAQKNRFSDAVPYDHNHVILTEHTNVSGSDYINASSITDHDPRNPAYIATQGPLASTAADFWQLVWEQGSVVILMLTRLTENGQALCHRYWPEEGSELYHIYEVHLVSEHIWCDDYLVRSFYLKNVRTGETRTVTQFHFLSWTDSGVPTSTKALLEFRRKVNKSYRGRSCPIIVHCSDGIGRTGTYCLIDMVLNRMAKGAKEIDIAATLEHIRDQRPSMVKTKLQFEFVLMAVAEEVHAILKALPQ